MQTLLTIWAWICANPTAVVFAFIIIANIVWSLIPATEANRKILNVIHAISGCFVTHASQKGTFTWPYVLQVILAFAQGKQLPSPTQVPIQDAPVKQPEE